MHRSGGAGFAGTGSWLLRPRVDTAQALTRFHYLARAVALACGGWIAGTPRLEDKALLARVAWEHSLAADSFRERVFELRYKGLTGRD